MTVSARRSPFGWFDACLRRWLRAPRPLRWVPVAAVVATLWWSSSRTPSVASPGLATSIASNAMHIVAFACVAATFWCAARSATRSPDRVAALAAIGFAIVYGIVDEVHQSHVPGRVASTWDVVSDACGGALGVWLLQRRIEPGLATVSRGLCIVAASCISVAVATFT